MWSISPHVTAAPRTSVDSVHYAAPNAEHRHTDTQTNGHGHVIQFDEVASDHVVRYAIM